MDRASAADFAVDIRAAMPDSTIGPKSSDF